MQKNEGIVIKTMNYKESSKILYLYTPMGKKSVLVRGANKIKSKYRNLSQLITKIEYFHTNSQLPILTDGEVINFYDSIKIDLLKTTYISHIFELINLTISEDSNHKKMYNFLNKLLLKIEQGKDVELISFIFELKLLFFIGVGPRLRSCYKCSSTSNLFFSIKDGYLLCENCKTNTNNIHGEILNLIRYFYYIDINDFDDMKISVDKRKEIRMFIDLYYDTFVNAKTNSHQLMKKLNGY